MHLPQIKVSMKEDNNFKEDWANGTMSDQGRSDSVIKLQLAKVLASEVFYDFEELAMSYDGFPYYMMRDAIENNPEDDNVFPPRGDDNLHIIHFISVIPVLYVHNIYAVNMSSTRYLQQKEDYYSMVVL
eukprot:5853839-Ditylum_brightwellii.AAC.1